MISPFARNQRRRRTTKGNFAFRRRKPLRTEVHRLDLNPETAASRRAQLRRRAGAGARWAFGLLSAIVFVALLRVVVLEAFVNNPKFRLQHVEIVTAGPLGKSVLHEASGLREGENLLMVSLRAVRDRLEALPEVRRAVVTRDFPGLIVLEVTQRIPVAWMECPDKAISARAPAYGCLLDDEGVVLPSAKHASPDGRLPVIRAEKLPRIVPGSKVESTAVLSALRLLQSHKTGPLKDRMQLGKIDATRPHALVAQFQPDLKAIFPADGDPAVQLDRLDRALKTAARRNWQIARIDFVVEHNVPVTLRGGAEAASVSAPPARTTLARAR